MRRALLAAFLSACASAANSAPVPKEQLLKPPADATHYVVVSMAGKHGDQWAWTLSDGSLVAVLPGHRHYDIMGGIGRRLQQPFLGNWC